jgi:hypothetical protein
MASVPDTGRTLTCGFGFRRTDRTGGIDLRICEMALHARHWLAGVGFRVPGLAVCWLTLPIGFAVLTMFIEELCGMLVHLGPAGAIRI